MLTDVPRTKARDAVDPGDVEDVHQEIQVGVFRDMTQHPLGGKDVLKVYSFIHISKGF